jgi:hypothetical protein
MAAKYSLKELFYWCGLLAVCFVLFTRITSDVTAGIATFGLIFGTVIIHKALGKATCLLFSIICSVGLIIGEAALNSGLSYPSFPHFAVMALPIGIAGGVAIWAIAVAADHAFRFFFETK